MFCHNCGAKVADNAAFCSKCGAKISGEKLNIDVNQSETNEESNKAFREYVDCHVRENTCFSTAVELLESKVPLRFVRNLIVIPDILLLLMLVVINREKMNIGMFVECLLLSTIISLMIGYIIAYIAGLVIYAKYSKKVSGKFEGNIDTDDLIAFLDNHLQYLNPYFHHWGYLSKAAFSVRSAVEIEIKNVAKKALKQECLCTEFGEKERRLCVIHIGLEAADSQQMKYYFSAENRIEGSLFYSHDWGFEKYKCLVRTAPVLQAAMEYYLNVYRLNEHSANTDLEKDKENVENCTSQNIERKETNNQETETKTGNISEKKNVKAKKSHAILGVSAALVVLILIIAVIGEIGDSESDDSTNVSTTVTTTGVNLSQSYVNEEEGFSFQYPEAWVPVSKEELTAYSESEESAPLVVLANRIEDLPEEDTYIMIFGFEVTQEVKDRLFVSDDEFAEHFDDDDLIIETSITEIDGVPAREITYLQSDGIGCQSYFYIVGTRFYRIDFVWRGETAGNNQRFFDAIMESYTIETEEIAETQENVQDVLLCQGVPIKDLVIFTTTEDIVGYFGEPDIREEGYYGGEDYIYNFGDSSYIDFYILENGSVSALTASPEIVTINGVNLRQGFDEVNKMLGEDYHAVGGGGPFEVYGWYTNDGCEITCQFSAEGESDEAISVIAEMATN